MFRAAFVPGIGALSLFLATIATAQDLDFEFWTAFSTKAFGVTRNTQILTSGVSAGWFIKGKDGSVQAEYLAQAIPVVFVFQGNTVYGGAITPAMFRIPFGHSPTLPYFDLALSLLFTTDDIPVRTSTFNFMPEAGFGVLLGSNPKRQWNLELNFVHISNGFTSSRNAGLNMLQLRMGFRMLL